MRRLLRATISLGGIAVLILSMAGQTMADKYDSLNFEGIERSVNAQALFSPGTFTNLNPQITQTAPIYIGDSKISRGGSFSISSFSGGAVSGGKRYTIPSPARVGITDAVPEPATLLLMATGLMGAAALLRKKRKGRNSL